MTRSRKANDFAIKNKACSVGDNKYAICIPFYTHSYKNIAIHLAFQLQYPSEYCSSLHRRYHGKKKATTTPWPTWRDTQCYAKCISFMLAVSWYLPNPVRCVHNLTQCCGRNYRCCRGRFEIIGRFKFSKNGFIALIFNSLSSTQKL